MTDFTDDDDLERRLGQAIADIESVPSGLSAFARNTHRLLSFENELAEIVADTEIGQPALRSSGEARMLQLRFDRIDLTIQIGDDKVSGSIGPTPPAAITLETTDGTRTPVELNDRGFFSFATPRDAFRLWLDVNDFEIRSEWLR